MSSLAKRAWVIGAVTVLIALGLGSISLYVLARDPYSESEIRRLVEKSYYSQRPGGARLFGAWYTPVGGAAAEPGLGKAQIALLRRPESVSRQRLQATIYLAAGDWRRFIEAVDRFPVEIKRAAEVQNNLGAAYLALSETDPVYILNALEAFERASKSEPQFVEPLFNLIITHRKLRFQGLASEVLKRYMGLDASSPWQRELTNTDTLDESVILDLLKQAIENQNTAEAEKLFEKNTELCRRLVMGYALRNLEESPAVVRFIASEMEHRYGDKTISAMIAPLFTDKREITILLRDQVLQAANLWAEGNFIGSSEAYAKASELLNRTDSVFDRLWLDLNRVDTQIKIGEFRQARESLRGITATARKNGLIWMAAKALSIYGSTLKLTSSYGEMLNLVEQANQIFLDIDAPNDRFRPLYYLAIYRYTAGDQDQALRLALECLKLSEDLSRISTLDWLIGSILYHRGMPERAVFFATQSVENSQNGSYAVLAGTAATTLAQLYESLSQHNLADRYLKIAQEASEKIPPSSDRTKVELLLGIVKARTNINQKRFDEAESVLQRNLEIYSRQPFPATMLLSQSLMLSAQVYSETGRMNEASRKFNEAIEVIENDDQYLKSEGLRVKFDDERRELYDSAIEFEYSNGSPDAAWNYLQKYRAKLFLEFLAAFNPNIERTRAKLDRAVIQQRLPKDTQLIEYALLKDRLLIWLVTDKLFTVRSVAVSRADLEANVQTVLEKLRAGGDVDLLLTELGKLLIEPVANLLDANRTIAIIPDRALHGLPFAVLRRPGKKEYLIQDFPIVVSPSLTHFLSANATQPRRDTIVGFGSQNGGGAELKELGALAGIYPNATTFAGRQVDKSHFLTAMNKASVFHYAGHSATDAVDPLRSSILLDGNRSGPNSVTAVDISQQRLANNAVVILSSCDSSVGNSRDGVGMRGLTSAFLIGGAGSVVGSLWPVEASSTADLMIRFHRAFANSQMPVANALREAQLTFLQTFPERSHPYYWSGFVVTGNFSALR